MLFLPAIPAAAVLLFASASIRTSHAYALPAVDTTFGAEPPVLIGDLATKGATTPVGQSIANILMMNETAQSNITGTPPATKNDCDADKCCVWYKVADDLTDLFLGRKGLCNDHARAAVRLGFHDAGTWSKSLAAAGQDFGGADGSFILFNEKDRPENNGLQTIVEKLEKRIKRYGVSAADMIQFAAIHATVTCPLGPRVRFFAGRKDATQASPPGLLPDVHSNSDTLIELFRDKTIDAHQLTALIGAHTSSKQDFVDPSLAGRAQDTTPGVWDVKFYNETLQTNGPKKVFKFPSDLALSKDPRVSNQWTAFVKSQGRWNGGFATAYVRLSLLGVNNINDLVECTQVLPQSRTLADIDDGDNDGN
ncbi:MAG: hypothetical protein M1813_009310 [Trichoglossum hirsutum]|nr:MAG: hypothetical protein M1813_009310 [Trichoglossum hirsutum]